MNSWSLIILLVIMCVGMLWLGYCIGRDVQKDRDAEAWRAEFNKAKRSRNTRYS